MIAVVFTLLLGSCLGLDPSAFSTSATELFTEADLNGDGKITQLELESEFHTYDSNGNGKESRQEYIDFICSVAPELHDMAHYLYDEFDMDQDHVLQKNDYDVLFLRMDTNKDGFIDPSEYEAFTTTMFQSYAGVGAHPHGHGCNTHGHNH